METNEEIIQKLKQSIHDYYMGYIKQKLNSLLANGKENEISVHIMQFLDAQLDTGNNIVGKDDIINILNDILLEDTSSILNNSYKNRISHCFPTTTDITIENGEAAYVVEKCQTLFNGIEERSYYLYVSPEYYDKNIKVIEAEIKKFEKQFSKQDLKNFEKNFNEDLTSKQYELESAKVYESAKNQIELKKQKFNLVNQKILGEYGQKYEEIISQEITDEEKYKLAKHLLEETKSNDEKNRQAILRLDAEYEKLAKNFKNKVQNPEIISNQMQNLHLFDKDRYFEDMKASVNPSLRDLYKKRYLLNSYRKNHNQLVYDKNKNVFSNIFKNFPLKSGKFQLALGPHFEREYTNTAFSEDIDKNLVKALAKFYTKVVIGETSEFENALIQYFKTNYKELTPDKASDFLYNFSQRENGDLFKIAKYFELDTKPFENTFVSDIEVKDGLVYEENDNGLNIIYCTEKAINNAVEDLYSTALYYKHLARENALASINTVALQNAFVEYAKDNDIELENYAHNKDLKYKKRFLKKKERPENIIDFKQSC